MSHDHCSLFKPLLPIFYLGLPEHWEYYTILHIPAEVWPIGAQESASHTCTWKVSREIIWQRSGHWAWKGMNKRSLCPFTCTEATWDCDLTTVSDLLTVLMKNIRQWKQHKPTLHNILVPDVLVCFCAQVYKNMLKGSVKDLVFLWGLFLPSQRQTAWHSDINNVNLCNLLFSLTFHFFFPNASSSSYLKLHFS